VTLILLRLFLGFENSHLSESARQNRARIDRKGLKERGLVLGYC
jgi:hypothetical protein